MMTDFRKRNLMFNPEHTPGGGFFDTTGAKPLVIGDGKGGEVSMPGVEVDWEAIREQWVNPPQRNYGLEWVTERAANPNKPAPGGFLHIRSNVIID